MSEAEGRFRERRSAHATGEEARPSPSPQAPPAPEDTASPPGPDPGGAPGTELPGTPPGSTPPDAGPGRKVPEGAFFDVVQYVVLRASQCLGEIPLDEAGERRVLPVEAKQYIDLLSTFHELLRSDLSPEAAHALDGVLTDLRTRFLEVT